MTYPIVTNTPRYLMTISGNTADAFDRGNYHAISYGIITVYSGFGSIQISTERGYQELTPKMKLSDSDLKKLVLSLEICPPDIFSIIIKTLLSSRDIMEAIKNREILEPKTKSKIRDL